MARTPTPRTPIAPESLVVQPVPQSAVEVVVEHDAMNAAAMALADQFGYQGNLSIGTLEDEIRFYQRRSVEAVLALGTRLLILKELTAHGEFIQRVELLGINKRMAQRFMGATLKLGKSDSKSLMTAAGTQTKLLELVVLDDEEIAELAEGGTAANLTLDDVARMTVTELRAALREARENEQATGRLLQDKNAKIDLLAQQIDRRPAPVTPMWDTRISGVSMEIANIGTVGDEAIGKQMSFLEVCEVLADGLDPEQPDYQDRLAQVRVPIDRLGEQLDRWAHALARLQFEFSNRLAGYQDHTHILQPIAGE